MVNLDATDVAPGRLIEGGGGPTWEIEAKSDQTRGTEMPPTLSYTQVSTKAATAVVVTGRTVTDPWIREGHRKPSEDSTK